MFWFLAIFIGVVMLIIIGAIGESIANKDYNDTSYEEDFDTTYSEWKGKQ